MFLQPNFFQINRRIFAVGLFFVGLFPSLVLADNYVPPLPPPPSLPGVPPLPPPPSLPGVLPLPPLPPVPGPVLPPTLPAPPILPPSNPVTPITPVASGQLEIWTDGFVTPITSGVRIIDSGDNINRLEWSSSDAVSCEGDGFDTLGLTEGLIISGNPSLIINSGQTKDFGIRCLNSSGVWSPWRFVEIIKNNVPPVPLNTAPNAPVIRGVDISTIASATGITGNAIPFTLKAIDPDGDNILYQVDWDNNGSVDQLIPGAGYVASDVPQSTNHTWVAGNYTFSVRAVDDIGNNSVWISHSITISDPAMMPPMLPVLWLEADRNLVRSGETISFRAKIIADYTMPCVIYGSNGGTINFNHLASPVVVTYSYTTNALFAAQVVKIICTPHVPGFPMPSVSDQIRINVVPQVQET